MAQQGKEGQFRLSRLQETDVPDTHPEHTKAFLRALIPHWTKNGNRVIREALSNGHQADHNISHYARVKQVWEILATHLLLGENKKLSEGMYAVAAGVAAATHDNFQAELGVKIKCHPEIEALRQVCMIVRKKRGRLEHEDARYLYLLFTIIASHSIADRVVYMPANGKELVETVVSAVQKHQCDLEQLQQAKDLRADDFSDKDNKISQELPAHIIALVELVPQLNEYSQEIDLLYNQSGIPENPLLHEVEDVRDAAMLFFRADKLDPVQTSFIGAAANIMRTLLTMRKSTRQLVIPEKEILSPEEELAKRIARGWFNIDDISWLLFEIHRPIEESKAASPRDRLSRLSTLLYLDWAIAKGQTLHYLLCELRDWNCAEILPLSLMYVFEQREEEIRKHLSSQPELMRQYLRILEEDRLGIIEIMMKKKLEVDALTQSGLFLRILQMIDRELEALHTARREEAKNVEHPEVLEQAWRQLNAISLDCPATRYPILNRALLGKLLR